MFDKPILGRILFPEEEKAFEIKENLHESREDSRIGRIKSHEEVMVNARKKLIEHC